MKADTLTFCVGEDGGEVPQATLRVGVSQAAGEGERSR